LGIISEKRIKLEVGELVIQSAQEEEAQEIIEFNKWVEGETDFLVRIPGEFKINITEKRTYIRRKREDEKRLLLTGRINGDLAAVLSFKPEEYCRYKHQGQMGMAVKRKYWGYGVGKSLLGIFLRWAFGVGIGKIILRVDEENLRAIKLYQSFGFFKEGLLKKSKHMGCGQYRDELIMALFFPENL